MRRALALWIAIGSSVLAHAAGPVTLTFVAGSGYIVADSNLRVAIDGLAPLEVPVATQALMSSASPPFDVDLIVVTHSDSDHFGAAVVAGNMIANDQAILVGPSNVIRAVRALAPLLAAERFVAVHPGLSTPVTLELAGTTVDAYSFPLPGPENVGYRVQVGGLSFATPGDLNFDAIAIDFARTGWTGSPPDVLILPYFLFNAESVDLFASSCPARLYVPTHAVLSDLATACAQGREVTANVLCFAASLEAKAIELEPPP